MSGVSNNPNNLNISQNMFNALFKDPKTEYLVNEILKNGKVDANDKVALGKLREHLEAAAKANDTQIDDQESSLLGALDSRGMFGTNETIVLQNLQKLSNLQKQASTINPNQLNFELVTQDGITGTFGGTQHRSLQLVEDQPHEAEPHNPAVHDTDHADAGAPLHDIGHLIPGPSAPSEQTLINQDMAVRSSALYPSEQAAQTATEALQADVEKISKSLQNTRQVPDSKLKKDLDHLGDFAESNPHYVLQVLDKLGVSREELIRQGVLPETAADATEAQLERDPEALKKLADFCNDGRLAAYVKDHPQALNGYRQFLVQTLENYKNTPSSENYRALKEIIYDASYVFESPDQVGQAAYDTYYHFKQTLLGAHQQNNLQKNLATGSQAPASLQELQNEVQSSGAKAEAAVVDLAVQAKDLLAEIKANPERYKQVDTQALQAILDELVVYDPTTKETKLKNPPAGQAQLNQLNHAWAELERVGLSAGLGNITASKGALTEALAAAPQANPTVQALKQAPELAQYSELLAELHKPGNEELLQAVISQDSKKVAELFNTYYSNRFSLDMNWAWDLGLGYGLGGWESPSFGFDNSFQLNQAVAPANTFGLTGLELDPLQNARMSGFDLGFAPDLGLNAPPSYMSSLALGALDTQTVPGLNLANMSEADVSSLMQLLAQNPQSLTVAKEQGKDLANQLQNNPELAGIQAVLDAKNNFDEAFWNNNSKLDAAQNAVQESIAARENGRVSLEMAAEGLKEALGRPDLKDGLRKELEAQQAAVDTALQEFKDGKPLTSNPSLDAALAGVARARKEGAVLVVNALIKQAEFNQNKGNYEKLVADLRVALNDPATLKALREKLPTEQKAELDEILAEGAETYIGRIETVLNDPEFPAEIKTMMWSANNRFLQLAAEAVKPEVKAADLAAMGKQNLSGHPHDTAFEALTGIKMTNRFIGTVINELGRDALSDVYQEVNLNLGDPAALLREDPNLIYDRVSSMLPNILASQRTTLALDAEQASRKFAQASTNPEIQRQLAQVFSNLGVANEDGLVTLEDLANLTPEEQVALSSELAKRADELEEDNSFKGIGLDPTQRQMTAEALRNFKLVVDQAVRNGGFKASYSEDIDAQMCEADWDDSWDLSDFMLEDLVPADPDSSTAVTDSVAASPQAQSVATGIVNAGVDELSDIAAVQRAHAGQVRSSIPENADQNTRDAMEHVAGMQDAQADMADANKEIQGARVELGNAERLPKRHAISRFADYLVRRGLMPGPVSSPLTDEQKRIIAHYYHQVGRASARGSDEGVTITDKELCEIFGLPENASALEITEARLALFNQQQAALRRTSPELNAALSAVEYLIRESIRQGRPLSQEAMDEIMQSLQSVIAPGSNQSRQDALANFQWALESALPGDENKTLREGTQVFLTRQLNSARGVVAADERVEGMAPVPAPTNVPGQEGESNAPAPENQTEQKSEDSNQGNDFGFMSVEEPPVQPGPSGPADVSVQKPGVSNPGQSVNEPGASSTVPAASDGSEISDADTDEVVEDGRTEMKAGIAEVDGGDVTDDELDEVIVESTAANLDAINRTYRDASAQERDEIGKKVEENLGAHIRDTETVMKSREQYAQKVNQAVDKFEEAFEDYKNHDNALKDILLKDPDALKRAQPSQAEVDAKTQALIDKADQLADRLILAPAAGKSGEELLSDLLKEFIDTIRKLDFDTRQLVLAQLAQQMLNNTITTYYKDKANENNKYHEDALKRISENMKDQIQHQLQRSMLSAAESSQAIVALSGSLQGASVSGALARVNQPELQGQFTELLSQSQQLQPPFLNNLERMKLEKAFKGILTAGGSPGTQDDTQALMMLNAFLSRN